MPTLNSKLAWLCLLAACSGALPPAAPPGPAKPVEPVTISVVTTNDLHGRIQQLPLLGGYVANLRRLREREGGAVLLIDAGDIFQGTLESNLNEGAAAVRAFNALGYAAAAVGNHEFDFGPVGPRQIPGAPGDDPLGALRARVAEAAFPFLSANLRAQPAGPFPIQAVPPSVLLDVRGVRVGIIGGITEGALTRTHPANTAGIALLPLAAAVRGEAQRLRSAGAVLVIATVHAGGECRAFDDPDDLSSCDPEAEVFQLAAALAPGEVDVIVAGHTHKGVAHRVHGVTILEAFSEGKAFGRVDLTVDRPRGLVGTRIHRPQQLCADKLEDAPCGRDTYEGAPVERASAVSAAIAADLAHAAAERARRLGVEVVGGIRREHDAESPLGNLIADLMREAFPTADAAINNGGSVRTSLPAGELTYGQLFEVFPFDNVFATVELTARELSAMVAANLQNDRGFLALSGIRAKARCTAKGLEVQLIKRDGRPFQSDARLTVVTSDFLARGGDGLMQGVPPQHIHVHEAELMRDALVRGLTRRSRIVGADKALFDPAHPRVHYTGQRPLHCLQ